MVWNIQRCCPVFQSKARMWPGVPGSVSGTLLGRISRSSNTTPGVLALTLRPSAGLPSPSRRSTRPSRPNDGIGRPVVLSRAIEEVAIGDEHAIGVHGDAAVAEARPRRRAAARVELPDLLAGVGGHGHHLQRRRGRVEHAVDDDRIALHLGRGEVVAALVGPGHRELADVGRRDLRTASSSGRCPGRR